MKTTLTMLFVLLLMISLGRGLSEELPDILSLDEQHESVEQAEMDEEAIAAAEEALKLSLKTIYRAAEKEFKIHTGYESFAGYCGYCTAFQLKGAGIYNRLYCCNGNFAWYMYSENEPESGMSVTLLPGRGKWGKWDLETVCRLLDEANTEGKNTYAVFCFKTGADTEAGQTYGHVLVVHAVFNGMVYWGDSAGPLIYPIKEFVRRYDGDNRVYVFDGAILFGFEETVPDSPDAYRR